MHELERDMRTIVDIAAKYRGSCKWHSEIDFNLAGIDMRAHEILEIIRLTRSGQHLNMPEEWKP